MFKFKKRQEKGQEQDAEKEDIEKVKTSRKSKQKPKQKPKKRTTKNSLYKMGLSDGVSSTILSYLENKAEEKDGLVRHQDGGYIVLAISEQTIIDALSNGDKKNIKESEAFGQLGLSLKKTDEVMFSTTLPKDIENGYVTIAPTKETLDSLLQFEEFRKNFFNWAILSEEISDEDLGGCASIQDGTVSFEELQKVMTNLEMFKSIERIDVSKEFVFKDYSRKQNNDFEEESIEEESSEEQPVEEFIQSSMEEIEEEFTEELEADEAVKDSVTNLLDNLVSQQGTTIKQPIEQPIDDFYSDAIGGTAEMQQDYVESTLQNKNETKKTLDLPRYLHSESLEEYFKQSEPFVFEFLESEDQSLNQVANELRATQNAKLIQKHNESQSVIQAAFESKMKVVIEKIEKDYTVIEEKSPDNIFYQKIKELEEIKIQTEQKIEPLISKKLEGEIEKIREQIYVEIEEFKRIKEREMKSEIMIFSDDFKKREKQSLLLQMKNDFLDKEQKVLKSRQEYVDLLIMSAKNQIENDLIKEAITLTKHEEELFIHCKKEIDTYVQNQYMKEIERLKMVERESIENSQIEKAQRQFKLKLEELVLQNQNEQDAIKRNYVEIIERVKNQHQIDLTKLRSDTETVQSHLNETEIERNQLVEKEQELKEQHLEEMKNEVGKYKIRTDELTTQIQTQQKLLDNQNEREIRLNKKNWVSIIGASIGTLVLGSGITYFASTLDTSTASTSNNTPTIIQMGETSKNVSASTNSNDIEGYVAVNKKSMNTIMVGYKEAYELGNIVTVNSNATGEVVKVSGNTVTVKFDKKKYTFEMI